MGKPGRFKSTDLRPPHGIRQLRTYLNGTKGIQLDDFDKRPVPHGTVQKYLLFKNPAIITGPFRKFFERYPTTEDGNYIEWSDTEVAYPVNGGMSATDIIYLREHVKKGVSSGHVLDLVEVKTFRHDGWRKERSSLPLELSGSSYHSAALETLKRAGDFYSGSGAKLRFVEVVYCLGQECPRVVYTGHPGQRLTVRRGKSVQIRTDDGRLLEAGGSPVILPKHHISIIGSFDVTREVEAII